MTFDFEGKIYQRHRFATQVVWCDQFFPTMQYLKPFLKQSN